MDLKDKITVFETGKNPELAPEIISELIYENSRLDRILREMSTDIRNGDFKKASDKAVKFLYAKPTRKMTNKVEAIQETVCSFFKIKKDQLFILNRAPHVSRPRMIAMFLIRKHLGLSYHAIGREFKKDHSTIIHAEAAIKNLIARSDDFREQIQEIEEMLPWIIEQ